MFWDFVAFPFNWTCSHFSLDGVCLSCYFLTELLSLIWKWWIKLLMNYHTGTCRGLSTQSEQFKDPLLFLLSSISSLGLVRRGEIWQGKLVSFACVDLLSLFILSSWSMFKAVLQASCFSFFYHKLLINLLVIFLSFFNQVV